MKKLIGYAMMGAPLVAIGTLCVMDVGWLGALVVFGIAGGLLFFVVAGSWLAQ